MNEKSRKLSSPAAFFGIALIVVGVLLLFGQLFHIRLGGFLWPLFVLVPGAAILVLALTTENQAGEGLAVFGGVVTAVGALLFYQNTTNHWQSWSYAWALAGPTAVGLSLMAYGAVHAKPDQAKSGRDLAKIGIIMFLVGAIFFELIIGISGLGLGRMGWAIGLVAIGVFLVVRNIVLARRADANPFEPESADLHDTARLETMDTPEGDG